MGWRDGSFEAVRGRKVIAVEESTLFLEDGGAFRFDLEGDCCSTSSFTAEGLAAFGELVGATIASVEDRGDEEREAVCSEKYPASDVDSWHFLVFTTDKGHVTVDWRNESNGYYDGTCIMVQAKPMNPVRHDAILEGHPSAKERL